MKNNKNYIFELVSLDLSRIGGPMGTEYTTDNWRKLFTKKEDAQIFAETDYKKECKDYKRNPEKIKWSKSGNRWHSQDLTFVMYEIQKREIF